MAAPQHLYLEEQHLQHHHYGAAPQYGAPVAQEYEAIASVFNEYVEASPWAVSRAQFDPVYNLLWVGDDEGRLTSYYGPALEKHTSWPAHKGGVRDLFFSSDSSLITVGPTSTRLITQGSTASFLQDPAFKELYCGALSQQRANSYLLAGRQADIVTVNMTRGKVVSQRKVEGLSDVVMMKPSSRSLCCASASGEVRIIDPRAMKRVQHSFSAHTSGGIADFDVSGNMLATCGFSQSSRSQVLKVDPFVKVFDLRTLRSLKPVQIGGGGPVALRFIPNAVFSSPRLGVATCHGQLQMCEPGNAIAISGGMMFNPQASSQPAHAFAVSSTGEAFAVGDAGGNVFLWGTSESPSFNAYNQEPDYAEPPVLNQRALNVDDMTQSLASFKMPYSTEPLLSDWPEEATRIIHRPIPKIPDSVLANIRITDFVGYAPNSLNLKRNQIPYPLSDCKLKTPRSLKGGRAVTPGYMRRGDSADTPMKRGEATEALMRRIPKAYRRVDIKYSRLGVEDFNFGFYNHTNFCGLEIHIPNAYCNAMLQVLYYLAPFRAAAESHWCTNEFCLACELGFVFHMLDQTPARNCQATNFLRSFRTIPQAPKLGLILNENDAESPDTDLQGLIQSWHTFVLTQVDHDFRSAKQSISKTDKKQVNTLRTAHKAVESLWGSSIATILVCQECSNESSRDDSTFSFPLQVPTELSSDEQYREYKFANLLRDSIAREQHTKAWCERCGAFKPTSQRRLLKVLPQVLALNCNTHKADEKEFWRKKQDLHTASLDKPGSTDGPVPFNLGSAAEDPGAGAAPGKTKPSTAFLDEALSWLPLSVFFTLVDGEYVVTEALAADAETPAGSVAYDLVASVMHIRDVNSCGNLVAHVRVSEFFNQLKNGVPRVSWQLFNDFAVSTIAAEQAVTYDMDWKVPCILYYTRRDIERKRPIQVETPVEMFQRTLLNDMSLASSSVLMRQTFERLKEPELPGPKTLVAIDAEFVSLAKEDAQIRSDGHKSTLKPSQMACARISVLLRRHAGRRAGKIAVIIDDYIRCSETVVDYLTQYSGIQPGDLDPTISTKHVTTLKASYSKLRFLEERGCLFVGHGLVKDFRVINLCLNPEQIIDTVNLYYLPNQKRRISLRFLAWYVLKRGVQGNALGHDSIEDARTALELYERYLELSKDPSEWNDTLQKLYDTGHKLRWKVPPANP